MGLFDFLSNDPQKHADGLKRKLMDAYRQSEERYDAMDKLAKAGTPQALDALLARFTLRVSGPTVDEEEKAYAHKLVSQWGEAAVEPLKRFIATHDAVYFPLKSLREISGDDAAVDALILAMDGTDPGYHEGLDRLREIVSNLRDFHHPRVREALVKLLATRSNEIRFFALDGLAGYPVDEIAEHFAARLLDPEESQRVKQLAQELMVEHQIPVLPWKDAVAAQLSPMYRLDEKGRLQRK